MSLSEKWTLFLNRPCLESESIQADMAQAGLELLSSCDQAIHLSLPQILTTDPAWVEDQKSGFFFLDLPGWSWTPTSASASSDSPPPLLLGWYECRRICRIEENRLYIYIYIYRTWLLKLINIPLFSSKQNVERIKFLSPLKYFKSLIFMSLPSKLTWQQY